MHLISFHDLVNRKFENVYIGWGLKYSAVPFNPQLPPATQEEFPSGESTHAYCVSLLSYQLKIKGLPALYSVLFSPTYASKLCGLK